MDGEAWRGRWRQLRNLEFYFQEVGGIESLHEVALAALERVRVLSGAADVLARLVLLRGLPAQLLPLRLGSWELFGLWRILARGL